MVGGVTVVVGREGWGLMKGRSGEYVCQGAGASGNGPKPKKTQGIDGLPRGFDRLAEPMHVVGIEDCKHRHFEYPCD